MEISEVIDEGFYFNDDFSRNSRNIPDFKPIPENQLSIAMTSLSNEFITTHYTEFSNYNG